MVYSDLKLLSRMRQYVACADNVLILGQSVRAIEEVII